MPLQGQFSTHYYLSLQISSMTFLLKSLKLILVVSIGLAFLAAAGSASIYFYLSPKLPSVSGLKEVQYQVPLQVFTKDKLLIAEYGSKKRDPLSPDQIPETMIHAILAAEDTRFFEHPGVDYQGILRAVINLATTGKKAQGGSTITMQVARNFFLTREKTYLRKLNEIILSLKIESELSKKEILALYLNKIYLGNRSYGIGSAAKIYYGKSIYTLNLAQYAMIAGLPKAPSRYNPLANTERALIRRDYVLGRMLTLGYINQHEHDSAKRQPATAKLHHAIIDIDAPYIGEMVRDHMYGLHGEKAYTSGYKVYVSIDPLLQSAAQGALRRALLAYEKRHGFRGPIEHIELSQESDFSQIFQRLNKLPEVGGLEPALIMQLDEQSASALLANGDQIELPWPGLEWANRFLDTKHKGPKPIQASDIFAIGDVVYVNQHPEAYWQLSQIPNVSGAIVAINPTDGSIVALVGGFDFFYSKFNRVTQAKRQPGSSFKPFIYSAALEQGFTTASIINDAPVVFDDSGLETSWRPENYSGRIYGPTRLRLALTHSRNLVSIRLLQAIGTRYAINYAQRFGFNPDDLPNDLSLSLGSANISPLELAKGYASFANGGFSVTPHFISRIEDRNGDAIFEADPAIACRSCELVSNEPEEQTFNLTGEAEIEELRINLAERIITPQNAYLMTNMMQDVVRYGTARRALQLKRKDLAGKTGTTNDQRDAWFSGFNRDLVAISWVGFDDGSPLGDRETGGRAALPMWIDFMRVALADKPEAPAERPEGLTTIRIDAKTGLLAAAGQSNIIFETFRAGNEPQRKTPNIDESINDHTGDEDSTPQLLF